MSLRLAVMAGNLESRFLARIHLGPSERALGPLPELGLVGLGTQG